MGDLTQFIGLSSDTINEILILFQTFGLGLATWLHDVPKFKSLLIDDVRVRLIGIAQLALSVDLLPVEAINAIGHRDRQVLMEIKPFPGIAPAVKNQMQIIVFPAPIRGTPFKHL